MEHYHESATRYGLHSGKQVTEQPKESTTHKAGMSHLYKECTIVVTVCVLVLNRASFWPHPCKLCAFTSTAPPHQITQISRPKPRAFPMHQSGHACLHEHMSVELVLATTQSDHVRMSHGGANRHELSYNPLASYASSSKLCQYDLLGTMMASSDPSQRKRCETERGGVWQKEMRKEKSVGRLRDRERRSDKHSYMQTDKQKGRRATKDRDRDKEGSQRVIEREAQKATRIKKNRGRQSNTQREMDNQTWMQR